MKTRVTFRVAEDIADALRELPNQTEFVERVLREALGMTCPVCGGEGRVTAEPLQLTDFKRARLPRVDRQTALQLKGVVRLARQLAATDIELGRDRRKALSFALSRNKEVLLEGSIAGEGTRLDIH